MRALYLFEYNIRLQIFNIIKLSKKTLNIIYKLNNFSVFFLVFSFQFEKFRKCYFKLRI